MQRPRRALRRALQRDQLLAQSVPSRLPPDHEFTSAHRGYELRQRLIVERMHARHAT